MRTRHDRRPMARLWRAALPVLLAALFALPGCFSRLTGNAGEFTFGYRTDVQIENFNKPLAPGSRLDLVAFEDPVDDATLAIVGAESSAPSVLTVASVSEERATIEAVSPGEARIEMTVRGEDGESVEDSVYMNVAEPTSLELVHTCTEADMAAYVSSEKVAVPFALASDDGRAVIGEEYVPVDSEPEGALHYMGKPLGRSILLFRAGPPGDRMRLRSKVDDTSLWLRLVRRSDIDQIRPRPGAEQARTVVGEVTFVGALPFSDGEPVCQSRALTQVKNRTPDVCRASADLSGDGSEWNRAQTAVIEGRDFGICRFEMTFPEADGGEGLTHTFEVPVGKFPEPRDEAGLAPDDSEEDDTPMIPWYLAPLLGLLVPVGFVVFVVLPRQRLPLVKSVWG